MTTSLPTDRVRSELETLVELLVPRVMSKLAAYTQWEVRVVASTPPLPPGTPGTPAIFLTPASVDVQAVDPAVIAVLGPAPLAAIPVWPGPDGCVATYTPGQLVRIGFVNGDLGKPYIAGCDPMVMPTVSLVGMLKVFCGVPVLTAAALPANAAALLTALEVLG